MDREFPKTFPVFELNRKRILGTCILEARFSEMTMSAFHTLRLLHLAEEDHALREKVVYFPTVDCIEVKSKLMKCHAVLLQAFDDLSCHFCAAPNKLWVQRRSSDGACLCHNGPVAWKDDRFFWDVFLHPKCH